MTALDAALWYVQHGFPVFPAHNVRDGQCSCGDVGCTHPGKHPRTARGFKDATKDLSQIRRWWGKWPDANIGLPTGPASGLLVIDIDPRNGGDSSWESLVLKHGQPPSTAEQITGGGGRHIVFRDPGVAVPKELAPGIDVKAAGGYIIVPPSTHPSGRIYTWDGIDGERALLDVADSPAWLLECFAAKRESTGNRARTNAKKFTSGKRNDGLASLAGTMRRRGMSQQSIEVALLEENQRRCQPPLLEAEVRRVAQSIASYQPGSLTLVGNAGRKCAMKGEVAEVANTILAAKLEASASSADKKTEAQILLEIAADVELFHTPETDPYAEVRVGEHAENWSLRSRGFRSWLIGEYFKSFKKPPRNQALLEAIGVLQARAHFDAPEHSLFVRNGGFEGCIYIDLGDEQHRVVEISKEGWRIISNSPVHFRRTKGMRALPEPALGGSLDTLRKYINVGSDSNWILCLAWLISAYRDKGPYTILILQGEQGSAKSTMARLLRRLVDPSVSMIRTPPRDERDLLIAASNSWVIAYDNLSGIPQWLSDSLCRLATGGGFSTRELFTDSEEVFFDAMRPVILNGIDHLAERADLADRALILNLPAIEESRRRDEAQLHAEFERDLPKIFGALLTAVSGTLAHLPDSRVERLPRMADFAKWATAAEIPLGLERGALMRAYFGNREDAIQETLESDPVGAALLILMDAEEWWEGTCKELLQRLEQIVDEKTAKSREWPKSPNAIRGRLKRLATFLRESGIHVVLPTKGARGRRVLSISKTPEFSATSATIATQAANVDVTDVVGNNDHGGELEAQVAKVALNSAVYNGHKREAVSDDIPCARCGPVCWQRLAGVPTCPNCGEGQVAAESKQVERYEL